MILNNAKYEAERRRQCEKRKTKKIDDRTEPAEEVNEGALGILGGRGGCIGYADRRKGTDWWNNRSLARAIASARHCARVAQQPGRLNGNGWMLASASDTRERSFSRPAPFLSPPSRRKVQLLILCPVSSTLRYVPICNWNLPAALARRHPLLVFSLGPLFFSADRPTGTALIPFPRGRLPFSVCNGNWKN